MSRSARREKRKNMRVMIGLGLTTTAFAAVAGSLVWAWAPQIGNWTLSPQQDFAESKNAASRTGSAWVPPDMPTISPWSTAQNSDTPASTTDGDKPTQVASVQTTGGSSGGHGPIDFENQQPPNNNFFGLFSSGGNPSMGGGQGSSWNGTFNPNGGGSNRGGFPSYGGGSGGTGGPGQPPAAPKQPDCTDPNNKDLPACQNQPQQQTNLQTPPTNEGGPGEGGPGEGGPGEGGPGQGGPGEGGPGEGGPGEGGPGEGGPGEGGPGEGGPGEGGPGEGGPGEGGPGEGGPGEGGPGEGGNPPAQIIINDPLAAIPEPGTLVMFVLGLLGLGWMVRRRA